MAINYEAGTAVSHTKQFYDSLPSGETLGQAAIAAGAGFAVGGVVGSAVALGYQFVLIPSADHAITQLFDKAESNLPSYINNSDTAKLGIKTAKTSLHFAVMGATASQGFVYGAFKAAAGIVIGNGAVRIADNVQDSLDIKPDSIGRRAINFMVGASCGYLGAEAAGRAMNSSSIVSETKNGSTTKESQQFTRRLKSVDENMDTATDSLRVKRQTVCPVEEQTVFSSFTEYRGTEGECSNIRLVDHVSSISYDSSLANSQIIMFNDSGLASFGNSLTNSTVHASGVSGFSSLICSMAQSTITLSDNSSALIRDFSLYNSTFNLLDKSRVTAIESSLLNSTLNVQGGSADLRGSAGQGLKAFVSEGVLKVRGEQALTNGMITVCNKGSFVNATNHEILTDDGRPFTLHDLRNATVEYDKYCQNPQIVIPADNPADNPVEGSTLGGIVGGVIAAFGIVTVATTSVIVCYIKRDALKSFTGYYKLNSLDITSEQAAKELASLSTSKRAVTERPSNPEDSVVIDMEKNKDKEVTERSLFSAFKG